MAVAQAVASLSKDRSTKVGAIALGPDREILSTGYNGPPRGVDDDRPERHEKPEKYFWFSHAEENLVAQAARSGVSLMGSTVLVTPLFPCSACARMLIQAGVKTVVYEAVDDPSEKWVEEHRRSTQMFAEAGVKTIKL